ncbi:MAG: hypothetical protein Q8882_00800 [Bacillota bacterium]|nr:hypothetical protein [Bacillota bacterium]
MKIRIASLVLLFIFAFSFLSFAEELKITEVQISTSAINGGQIYCGTDNWSTKSGVCNRGTEYTLEAKSDKAIFLYWQDNTTGKIISKEKILTILVLDNVDIKAVFVPNSTMANVSYTTFFDYNGNVLQAGYNNKIPPSTSNLESAGYNYSGWTPSDYLAQQIGSIYTVTPNLTKKDQHFNVSVAGGFAVPAQENYEYDTFVTVVADESAVPSGKHFKGWSVNGSFASYDKTFSLLVGCNSNITAVYSDTEPVKDNVVAIIDGSRTIVNGAISFLSYRNAIEGCTVLDSGILYASSTFAESLTLDSVGVLKGKAQSKTSSGMYRLNVKAYAGDSIKACAYMIYKYNDKLYVIYSDTITVKK